MDSDTNIEPATALDLGEAENFAILAKSGVSTVPTSAVTGDIGISPASATYLTGFSLTADASNIFATSPQVTGRLYASDYALPTPSDLTTAVGDMELAFTDAAGRAPDVTELGAGDIGGMTLEPGVYAWGTSLILPTEGIILTQTSITLRTGASIDGRLLAQAAVDLDGNTVVEPAG